MTHRHPGLGFGFGLGPRRWATRGERRLNRVGGPGRPERQTRPVVWNRQQPLAVTCTDSFVCATT